MLTVHIRSYNANNTDLKINMEYFILSLHSFVEQHILTSWRVYMIC